MLCSSLLIILAELFDLPPFSKPTIAHFKSPQWLSLGVTPAGPFFSISILAFFATLVGIEFLFYKYWTSLNIFETLTYLSGLSVVAFVTGQRALSEVRARRKLRGEVKHQKKE